MIAIEPFLITHVATQVEIEIQNYTLGAPEQDVVVLFLDGRGVAVRVDRIKEKEGPDLVDRVLKRLNIIPAQSNIPQT